MQYTGGGLPGPQTSREFTYRSVRRSQQGAKWLPGGVVVKASLSRDPLNTSYGHVLRSGLLMGKITTTGLWAPAVIGLTTANYTSGGTSLTVSAATAVEILRRIGASGTFKMTSTVDATTAVAAGYDQKTITYSAINTTTGVITITNVGADVVAGSVIGDTDGSAAPLGLIDDGDGIRVTDVDGNNVDQPLPRLLVGGDLDTAQIINYPTSANTALIAWLKGKLNNASNYGFMFSDAFLP